MKSALPPEKMSFSKIVSLGLTTTAICSRNFEISALADSIQECDKQIERYNDRKLVVEKYIYNKYNVVANTAELKTLNEQLENICNIKQQKEERKRVVIQKLGLLNNV